MIHTIFSRLLDPKIGKTEKKEANSKVNCGKFAHHGETLHRRVRCRVSSATSKEQGGEPVTCIKVRSLKNKLPSSKFG